MWDISTILLASADEAEWTKVHRVLANDYGYRVILANDLAEAMTLVEDAPIDLVITEATLQGEDALKLLRHCRLSCPEAIRILVKEAQEEGHWNQGAVDLTDIYQFIRKPLDEEQVGLVVKRALETRELARRHRLISHELKLNDDNPIFTPKPIHEVNGELANFEKLIFISEPMADLCAIAKKAAKSDLPILIQGETGTGKELLARAIHFNSKRTQSPLLTQNCGGISDEHLHSELFGHKRGSFTGAIGDRLGLFRAADGGTVFLDEISDVSPSFQVNLLRFLQEGEIKPLGADHVCHANVRVIVASNQKLEKLVEAGKFRQDLYFRLKGVELNVPPLRQREADITILAKFFTQKYSQEMGHNVLGIAQDVIDRFEHYSFPGNVRELENEVRRMVALAQDGEFLTARLLSPEIATVKTPAHNMKKNGLYTLEGTTLKEKVEALEKMLVSEALARHRWNQSQVARELGLSRVGLANKIKRYEIEHIQ